MSKVGSSLKIFLNHNGALDLHWCALFLCAPSMCVNPCYSSSQNSQVLFR